MKDYYAILGIPSSASQSTIRDAYRRLAKKYHPDVNSSPDAEQIFKEVNEAYEILGDPEKRSQYDNPTYYVPIEPTPQPKHRDPAYRRQRRPKGFQESSAQRLKQLKEEYKNVFLWICRVGLGFVLLIALDVVIPSILSDEEIIGVQYYRGSRRTAGYYAVTTDHDRKFNLYPYYYNSLTLSEHSVVTLQISPIFSNVLTIKLKDSESSLWIASIYRQFSFFPIILLIASSLGMLVKANADVVLNCGTVSFVMGLICVFFIA